MKTELLKELTKRHYDLLRQAAEVGREIAQEQARIHGVTIGCVVVVGRDEFEVTGFSMGMQPGSTVPLLKVRRPGSERQTPFPLGPGWRVKAGV